MTEILRIKSHDNKVSATNCIGSIEKRREHCPSRSQRLKSAERSDCAALAEHYKASSKVSRKLRELSRVHRALRCKLSIVTT
eukprot:5314017-Pleurochrysis_carterae.AAC.1